MAQITLNFSQSEDARIRAAFQARLGLGSPASDDDIKAELVLLMQQIVENEERDAARRALPTQARVEIT